LITAEKEEEINEALLNDFTTTDTSNLSIGQSYGIGCGFQIYLKGEFVLTVGCGGGGGRYNNSHIECGGGGGATIYVPNSNIKKARVGGGHGMQEGFEKEHDETLYMEQLDKNFEIYLPVQITIKLPYREVEVEDMNLMIMT
jgi:hypothetical protein